MASGKPITTAPRDGSKITVYWTDKDGQENESIAQYRSLEQLKNSGGEWDESDAGWWTFIDGDTQQRIEPHSWNPHPDEEDEEGGDKPRPM
ncbi:hypothetical protein [Aquamicrobium sp. LC103]|uniref:hypothetical protein n=1 Tax=Aquamicrobium sp. LC103 TaxID=1120658 RepID=UPI00063ED028|nr:hypothetical protein [Aquamicrobium sp. LC103]TKT74211.1 hypothetical protein XW59_024685 [Aquamicrobium sp. LC103]